jgi:putative ABC transport system ATP-binding protein
LLSLPIDNPREPLRLVGVGKRYAEREVLHAIDLTIARGEFAVVTGRSGSGKSTLLNLLGGLDRPSSGEIELFGHSLAGIGDRELSLIRRHLVGFVFQFFNLIPTLTIEENLRLPLALNGTPAGEVRRRVEAVLTELELESYAARLPEELSGGEQQRVAIGRAIVHRPPIVLADEPTGNLDLETARGVIELLDTMCRRYGTTLVMATHAPEVIGRADRIFTIRNARLEETRP